MHKRKGAGPTPHQPNPFERLARARRDHGAATTKPMQLQVMEGTYALTRLDGTAALPDWFSLDAPLAAAVRRGDELSLLAPDDTVPDGARAERGWRALEVAGPLDLALTGITADLSGALAKAGVAIVPLGTYDTDVILVRDDRLDDAVAALRSAGHTVS